MWAVQIVWKNSRAAKNTPNIRLCRLEGLFLSQSFEELFNETSGKQGYAKIITPTEVSASIRVPCGYTEHSANVKMTTKLAILKDIETQFAIDEGTVLFQIYQAEDNKEVNEEESATIKTPGKFTKAALIGVGVGAGVSICVGVAAFVAAPLILGAVGFTAVGIAAGSTAAGMMSSAAIANGGGIAAGSLVAILQSLGTGAGIGAVAAVSGGAVGTTAGITAGTIIAVSKDKGDNSCDVDNENAETGGSDGENSDGRLQQLVDSWELEYEANKQKNNFRLKKMIYQ